MKKYRSRAIVPLFLLPIYLLLLLTRLIPPSEVDTTVKLFFALTVLELFIFALPTFFFCKLRGQDYVRELSLEPFSPKSCGFLVSIGFLVLSVGLLVNALFYFWGIGSASYTSLGSFILSEVSIDKNPLYVIFAYGAIPALCEEFLFRGVLIAEYKKYSFTAAAIFSSFAYALCYFDLAGLPFYFASGLLLAYTVRITGSVFAAMLTRFFINVASIYLMPPLWQLLTQPLGELFATFIAVAILMVALTLVLFTAEKEYRRMATDPRHADDRPFPKKLALRNTLKALSSPTFLICFGVYAVAVTVILVTK